MPLTINLHKLNTTEITWCTFLNCTYEAMMKRARQRTHTRRRIHHKKKKKNDHEGEEKITSFDSVIERARVI